MIERIAKLIALAENASTVAEAEAAFAKAQELASKYAIDLEVARRAAAPKARQTPVQRIVRIGEKGKRANASLVMLYTTIGRANDVHCLVAQNSTWVQANGFPSDLDAVAGLWSALAVTMTKFADDHVKDKGAAWRSETYFDETTWNYRPVTGQGARRSFNEGFIDRIGERLQEARQASIREADLALGQAAPDGESSSTALVLRDKSAEVEKHMWSEFERKHGKRRPGAWGGHRSSATRSSSAERHGRAAAERASLSGRKAVGA